MSRPAIAAAEAARRHFLEAGRPVDAADQLIGHAIMIRRDVQPMAERQRYLDQAAAELNALPVSADRALALSDVLMMRAMLLLDVGRLDDADAAIVEGRAQRQASGDTDTGDLDFVGASIDVVRGRTSEGIERMMDVARGAREARRESTGVTSYRMAAAFAMRVMDYERAEVVPPRRPALRGRDPAVVLPPRDGRDLGAHRLGRGRVGRGHPDRRDRDRRAWEPARNPGLP